MFSINLKAHGNIPTPDELRHFKSVLQEYKKGKVLEILQDEYDDETHDMLEELAGDKMLAPVLSFVVDMSLTAGMKKGFSKGYWFGFVVGIFVTALAVLVVNNFDVCLG